MSHGTQEVRISMDLLIPPALGDGLISTGVVRYLLGEVPGVETVTVWTARPWLFAAFAAEDRLVCRAEPDQAPSSAIDLSEYLARLPHRRVPPRHHVLSMLEIVGEHLGAALPFSTPLPRPIFSASDEEKKDASDALAVLSEWIAERSVVWLCARSTTPNRNPKPEFWVQLAELLADRAALVDLLAPQEAPLCEDLIAGVRLAPGAMGAFMEECAAGIAVDTFGLHVAGAVGCRNVVAVLGSSHPECVCYPGNRPVYRVTARTQLCQPCGNHGYADDELILKTMAGVDRRFQQDNRCLFPDVPCLSELKSEEVSEALVEMLPPAQEKPRRSWWQWFVGKEE